MSNDEKKMIFERENALKKTIDNQYRKQKSSMKTLSEAKNVKVVTSFKIAYKIKSITVQIPETVLKSPQESASTQTTS
jgi:hypothetical protein